MPAWWLIPTALSALGAVEGNKAGKKATKAQEAQNEAQRKINKLRNKQAKRQFLRNYRQAQAATLVQGVAAGVGLESSLVQGNRSSQESQARLARSEFGQMDVLGAAQTQAMNDQSRYQHRANIWGQATSFASSFIGFGPFSGD